MYDPEKPQGERVQSALVGSEELDPYRIYTIATNNFVALGGDYPELANAPECNQYAACDEALTRFIQRGQQVVDSAAHKVNLSEKTVLPDQPQQDSGDSGSENENSPSPKTGDPFESAVACLFVIGAAALSIRSRKGF